MSYFLADRDGYVGEIASINGYMEMREEVLRHLTLTSPLGLFLADGETDSMEYVIKDIDSVLPKISIQSVKSTLEELKSNLIKAKEIAIVSQ